jgi:hypothetical protein
MRVRSVLASVLLGLVVYAYAYPISAQQPDVRGVVERYKQALVALDGPAVASLFDDHMVINDLGMTANGKAEAIAELSQVVAQNPQLGISFSDTEYVLNTAVERLAFSSDPVRAAGAGRLWTIETIVASNGKIVSYTAVFDTSDPETARFLAAMAVH